MDSGGNAYVAGSTESRDFPAISPVQASPGGAVLLSSTDGGTTWSPANTGLISSDVRVVETGNTSPTVYAGGTGGVFASQDGGTSWKPAGLTDASINILAVDPRTPTTIYAAGGSRESLRYPSFAPRGVFQSTNGARTWRAINMGLPSLDIHALVINPLTPSTLYVGTDIGIFKTVDSGGNWTEVGPGSDWILALAIDPERPSVLYAMRYTASNTEVLVSEDAGTNWKTVLLQSNYYNDFSGGQALIVDPHNSSTIHALMWGAVLTTNDSGGNWRSLFSDSCTIYTLALVPGMPSSLYAGGTNYTGRSYLFHTTTGGQSRVKQYNSGVGVSPIVVSQSPSRAVYAATYPGGDAFVTKLSSDGSVLVYSTYLGGARNDGANAIAIDSNGNVWVAGSTLSADFPLANPLQSRIGESNGYYPGGDAFVVKLKER